MMRLFSAAFAVILFASCASIPVSTRPADVEDVVQMINTGQSERLAKHSQVPFMFDGEILLMEQDMNLLWGNLRQTGFALREARVESLERAGENSYRLFAETMEAEVYFRKYLPENAMVARVTSSNGDFILLLGGRQAGFPMIYGLRGPVQ